MNIFRAFAWCFLFNITAAEAVIISPAVMELNADKNSAKQLTVTNTSSEKIPIEVGVYKLEFDKDGNYSTTWVKNDELFVFPPATLLVPGGKQTFRVQWLNTTSPDQSHSYFIRFSQLTLATANAVDTDSQISFRLHYNALVHVVADDHQADVLLQVDEQGERLLINRGNRFTYTSTVSFTKDDPLGTTQWDEVLGERFIPPHSLTRLPAGQDIPPGQYRGLVF